MKLSLRNSIETMKKGQPVLCLLKDAFDNSHGALLLAAETASAAGMNLLIREGKGVVCVGVTAETAERLELAPMIPTGSSETPLHAVSTVSVDAKDGITTGISAGDRAHTLKVIASPAARPDDLVRPGHLFPYIAHPNGVLGRPEMAEAAVDMARLAGLVPVSAYCGVLDTNGALADETYLRELADKAGVPVFQLADLIEYRLTAESFVQRSRRETIATRQGSFELVTYADRLHEVRHSVLRTLHPFESGPSTVYVHRACLKADVFGARREDGLSIEEAQGLVQRRGGLIVYLAEGVTDMQRASAAVAHILTDQGIRRLELVSPWEGLARYLTEAGFTVTEGAFNSEASAGGNGRIQGLAVNSAP